VSRTKFTTDKSRRIETARYQSGTEKVPNPFYEQHQRDVTEQEQRVVQEQQDVMKQQQYVEQYTADVQREGDTPNVSTGAEQNLHNAKSRLESERRSLKSAQDQLMQKQRALAGTEQYKDEPVYTDAQYTVTTHLLRASAQLTGALDSGPRGNLPVGRALVEEARDDERSGNNQAGVASDQLELPSTKLMEQALAELKAQINAGFQAYRASYKEKAESATSDDARVENFVIYVLLDPGSTDPSIDQRLQQLRGVPGAITLLGGSSPTS
jgi:hypothetical protein